MKLENLLNFTVEIWRCLFLDMDECEPVGDVPFGNNCHDYANCTNTKGSFQCTCHTGYSGDGVICVGKLLVRE